MREAIAGELVRYKTFANIVRTVRVTTASADIKNGKPGFEGADADSGETVWGYDSQIIPAKHKQAISLPAGFVDNDHDGMA